MPPYCTRHRTYHDRDACWYAMAEEFRVDPPPRAQKPAPEQEFRNQVETVAQHVVDLLLDGNKLEGSLVGGFEYTDLLRVSIATTLAIYNEKGR